MSHEKRGFIHPKPAESLQPERLPFEQIADLLAGLGNSESKAITFLTLAKAQGTLTRMGLYYELMGVQGEKGWKISNNTPFGYCTDSLAPIGLVAKEVVDETRKIYGYEITPDGEKIGVPLAGLLLDWSLRYPEFSLHQIFGSTHSPVKTKETTSQSEDAPLETYKNRSPGTVFQILQSILTRKQPIRLTDVAADIGKKEQNITKHLSDLSRNGIITYQASRGTIEGKRPVVFYSLPENKFSEKEPPVYNGYKTLTHDVYEVCREHVKTPLSAQDVMKLLIEKNQKYSQLKQKSFRSLISSILHFLSEKKHLINTADFSSLKLTDISLNEKQREALTDLVNIILAFQKQDPSIMAFGKKRAREIRSDQESVSKLMRKAKEHSPLSQKRSPEEIEPFIIIMINHKSQEMTMSEIQKKLQEQFGIKLSRERIRLILKKLIAKKEGLSIQKIGNNSVYSLT